MIKKTIHYPISDEQAGLTAEQFLKSKGYSHRLVVRLKHTPMGLSVDGKPAYATRRLSPGEVLTVHLTEEETSHSIVPVRLPLDIVYEDEDLLVINKEAGVPVHPSQGHYTNTLANGLAWYFREKGQPFTCRAVNRLDRDTTGLLLFAKHMLSACILSSQILNRSIHREYRALVQGEIQKPGTITAPIARKEGSTIERQVDYEKGEAACTHYSPVCYSPRYDLSLISLWLETGRTHQIRVHLRSVGHPLPGDFLYNPDYRCIARQPLHSFRLSFIHPMTGELMKFKAGLPEDMASLLRL